MNDRPSLLIEPARWLAGEAIAGATFVHVGDAEGYAAAHLPGAALVTPGMLQRGLPPAVGELPEAAALDALGAALGLADSPFLLVYDDEGGAWAGRLIWTLDVLAYPHCAYLDGGLHAWRSVGGPLEAGAAPSASPTPYRAALNRAPIMDREALRSRLGDPNLAIWDARSAVEYEGTRRMAARGGHIPGAVHCEWLEMIDPRRDMRLRDLETLRSELAARGLPGAGEVVTHCQTHHRSGLTYLVGKLLGWRIRAYPGSWGDWGNREDTPVVQGPEPGAIAVSDATVPTR